MLRRPPVFIDLKLEDLLEYENYRREQEVAKEQAKSSKPAQEPPAWSSGPKSKQEMFERIGFVPAGRGSGTQQLY